MLSSSVKVKSRCSFRLRRGGVVQMRMYWMFYDLFFVAMFSDKSSECNGHRLFDAVVLFEIMYGIYNIKV